MGMPGIGILYQLNVNTAEGLASFQDGKIKLSATDWRLV
jgi:hypothetical protein